MRLVLSLFGCCGLLHGAFDTHAWEWRRLLKTTAAPFNAVTVDGSIYQSSQAQLRDLRLIRQGSEVPYILKTFSASREERKFTPSLLDKAAVPGVGVQAVLEVGRNGPHDRLTVETYRTDFKQQVIVETSDDGEKWGVVRRDGLIFDISTGDQHAASLSVSYPESTRHFVRITIAGWKDPTWLRSAAVSYVSEASSQRNVIGDFRPKVTEKPEIHTTVLDFDLGFARPCGRITFSAGPGLFSRAVSIASSANGKAWLMSGFGTLARTTREETLTVEFPEQWGRYLQVSISNEDNAPLHIASARLEAFERKLTFPAEAPGPYWLYSGNPATEEARYDLASVVSPVVAAIPATAGPAERNPDYQTPKPPVSERSPWFLTALLVVLVPLMGWIVLRLLRQVKTAE